MNFTKHNSSVALLPFVRHYWMFEVTEKDIPFSQLFFPYGSFELIFYLNGEGIMKFTADANSFKQERSFYSGQFTRSFELKFIKPCKCIGVSFHPWVGNLLYGIPSSQFTNEMIPLHTFEKDNHLYEELLDAKNNDELFEKIELYLQERLIDTSGDEIVNAVTNCIINKPDIKIVNSFIEKNIGLSKRRIQMRFLDSVGLSMISFIRKVRFQKSLHYLTNLHSTYNLTEIGLDSGYYDQAHFINEFRSFTSITPSKYVKQNTDLKEFIQSLVIS